MALFVAIVRVYISFSEAKKTVLNHYLSSYLSRLSIFSTDKYRLHSL
jgi:hypothetical protein